MASTADVLSQIARAFADPPRPADDELLHPDARDDNDIKSLYGVAHWRDLSDEGDLRDFSLSKFALFDDAQRSAVLAFLEAMISHEDVDEALQYWRSEIRGSRPGP
jgi:hypothetical protein